MASDLIAILRSIHARMPTYHWPEYDRLAVWAAADAPEGYERAETERLEREAVSPEDTLERHGWTYDPERGGFLQVEGREVPLIPMPQDYPTMFEYTEAMTGWVRAVTATERSDA